MARLTYFTPSEREILRHRFEVDLERKALYLSNAGKKLTLIKEHLDECEKIVDPDDLQTLHGLRKQHEALFSRMGLLAVEIERLQKIKDNL